MSTKTKASSKNKKATFKKAVKKVTAKKTVAKKKVSRPSVTAAKAKPVKKSTAKSKPVVKKVIVKAPKSKVAKPVKKVAVKKTIKAAVKKIAKPAKKVITKKLAVKKIAKKVAKPIKKAVVKKVIEKTIKKVAPAKVVVVKTPIVKPEKPLKVKKEKPAPVKKQIVAPTTFRTETINPVQQKSIKEPAGKFEMEFVIRASEDMVFEFVSTESGLSEWFCDDVNIRDGVFTFDWDGQIQQAKLVKEIPPQMIRYQWLDKNDGSYFEFRIQKDELTNDISLIITDFASDKADEVSARLLWHSQVDKLLHVLGSFF